MLYNGRYTKGRANGEKYSRKKTRAARRAETRAMRIGNYGISGEKRSRARERERQREREGGEEGGRDTVKRDTRSFVFAPEDGGEGGGV